jgi:hypothetical protein
VEVRGRFEQRWARGFEIAEVLEGDGNGGRERVYRVRRRSDGAILPVVFAGDDLREERRRQPWWV